MNTITILAVEEGVSKSASLYGGAGLGQEKSIDVLMRIDSFKAPIDLGFKYINFAKDGEEVLIQFCGFEELEALYRIQEAGCVILNRPEIKRTVKYRPDIGRYRMTQGEIAQAELLEMLEFDTEAELLSHLDELKSYGDFKHNLLEKCREPGGIKVVHSFEYTEAPCLVLNLTQHQATPEQVAAGVLEPENKAAIQAAITFDTLPTCQEIENRATLVAAIAKGSSCSKAMIGGAPFFMSALERQLLKVGVTPLYAFSERVSIEESLPDGTVKKTNIFKHVGFVEV